MTKRQTVLLLASYCGDDNPKCTDDLPCEDCLKMCNVASAELSATSVHAGWDHMQHMLGLGETATGETK